MNRWARIATLLVLFVLIIWVTGQCSYETGRWMGAN
jgi:hypothetical protein